ncbi:MAG: hypothetical protein ABSH20_04180 [Tepidisphaeraceae bacterium]|jgi:predicted DNA-binding transcriptional regulator AlpA
MNAILPENVRSKPFLTSAELAGIIGWRDQSLAKARMEGRGPDYIRVGSRSIRYTPAAVEKWLAANAVELCAAK